MSQCISSVQIQEKQENGSLKNLINFLAQKAEKDLKLIFNMLIKEIKTLNIMFHFLI